MFICVYLLVVCVFVCLSVSSALEVAEDEYECAREAAVDVFAQLAEKNDQHVGAVPCFVLGYPMVYVNTVWRHYRPLALHQELARVR